MLILHDTETNTTYRLGNYVSIRPGLTYLGIDDEIDAPAIHTMNINVPEEWIIQTMAEYGGYELDAITTEPEDRRGHLRMAKAPEDEIDQLRTFFQQWEEKEDDWTIDEETLSKWLKDQYPRISRIWRRIVEGYVVLLHNAVDPNAATLEWKPELVPWIALASHIKELEDTNSG